MAVRISIRTPPVVIFFEQTIYFQLFGRMKPRMPGKFFGRFWLDARHRNGVTVHQSGELGAHSAIRNHL